MLCQMLQMLDEQTNFLYKATIQKRMKKNEFLHFINIGKYKEIMSKKYRDLFNQLSITNRLKIKVLAYFPFLVTLKRKLTRKS